MGFVHTLPGCIENAEGILQGLLVAGGDLVYCPYGFLVATLAES